MNWQGRDTYKFSLERAFGFFILSPFIWHCGDDELPDLRGV